MVGTHQVLYTELTFMLSTGRSSQHDDQSEECEGCIFGAVLQVSWVQLSAQVQGCRDKTHNEDPAYRKQFKVPSQHLPA